MKTIKIQVRTEIYDKLIKILNQFNAKDLKVLKDDTFEAEQKYLEAQLKELESGHAEYLTIDELDSVLEEAIEKYGH